MKVVYRHDCVISNTFFMMNLLTFAGKILRLVLCTCMFIRRLLNNNYIIMHNYDSHYINFGGVVFINFSNFAI